MTAREGCPFWCGGAIHATLAADPSTHVRALATYGGHEVTVECLNTAEPIQVAIALEGTDVANLRLEGAPTELRKIAAMLERAAAELEGLGLVSDRVWLR